MKIDLSRLGREPAVLSAALALAVQVGTVVLADFSPEQQAAINALAVALAGVVTAWGAAADKLLPFLTGLVQAGIALALAFGLHLSADEQSTIMGFVTMLLGLFLRTQLYARVGMVTTNKHYREDFE